MKDDDKQLSSVSKASTYEEMGEFWDTHDLTDYWDQTYDVEFEVSDVIRNRVYLTPELYERVKAAAKRQGIRIEVLVNKWVEERLMQEGKSKAAARVDEGVRSE